MERNEDGPVRAARKEIASLMLSGMPRREAAAAVADSCVKARGDLAGKGITETTWLDQVQAEAKRVHDTTH